MCTPWEFSISSSSHVSLRLSSLWRRWMCWRIPRCISGLREALPAGGDKKTMIPRAAGASNGGASPENHWNPFWGIPQNGKKWDGKKSFFRKYAASLETRWGSRMGFSELLQHIMAWHGYQKGTHLAQPCSWAVEMIWWNGRWGKL